MLNRRSLLLAGGACAFAPLAARADQIVVHSASHQLYRHAMVLDCNVAPPFPIDAAGMAAIKDSGITACKATIGGFNNDYDATLAEIDLYDQQIAAHPDMLMQIRNASDFAEAKRRDKLGVIYSFEGVEMLRGSVHAIDFFAKRGVRVMQLSYNLPSPFGAGVLVNPPTGLTDLGRAAIVQMNSNGVAVDLSHAGPLTTSDAMAASTKPVIMSHGGCAAVQAHPRNKTDAQLRALAEKGGVLGIYDLPYLTVTRQPTLDDYIAHMTHALSVMGEDHVGVGSDAVFQGFDASPENMAAYAESNAQRRAAGVAAPGEEWPPFVIGLNSERRCEVIADALLRRGYSMRATEKVLGQNFIRVFSEIW